MKKSFGLAKVFLIGILAIGLFGLLSFAFAGVPGQNPGHAGIDICDDNFCVAQATGIPIIGIGTTLPGSSLHVNVSGQGSLFRLESIFGSEPSSSIFEISRSINDYFTINSGNLLKIDSPLMVRSSGGLSHDFASFYDWGTGRSLIFTKEFVPGGPNVDNSWVIRTNENALSNGAPLKIGTTYQGVNKRLDLELSNDLIFSDGSRQNTAAPGNCVVESAVQNLQSGPWGSLDTATATLQCSSGTRTGGGCKLETSNSILESYPSSNNGWTCTDCGGRRGSP